MPTPSEQISLPALVVNQRETRFYSVVLKARDLVRLCAGLTSAPLDHGDDSLRSEVSKKEAEYLVDALNTPTFAREVQELQEESYDECEPYQRLLDFARARSIAAYVKEPDALLPNGIILATRSDVDVAETQTPNGLLVQLSWANLELPLNIIDGQHRVEGLKLLVQERDSKFSDFEIPATLLIDLPFWVQAELFAVVNGRQKQVPASRVYDLLGYLPMQDEGLRKRAYKGEMALQRFSHHVVKVLNRSESSPWKNRIKMRGSGVGVISQAALVDHMVVYIQPRKERSAMRVLPLLFSYYNQSDIVGIAKILVLYFLGIREAHPKYWADDGVLKTTLFGKTNGVAVMLQVMHDLMVSVEGAQNLTLSFVKEMWSKIPADILESPPKGGSKGFQNEMTQKILHLMFGEEVNSRTTPSPKLLEELRSQGGLFSASLYVEKTGHLPLT